jgi:transcriptional regulator with XRE-family HTH domain
MLGQRLTELRKAKKLTQEEIAKKLHMTRSTYAQYEVDRRVPEYATLEKLADFFDVSIDYLVGRTNDRKVVATDTDKKHPAQILREYLDMGLTNEEIKKRMDFMVDVFTLNDKEVDEFISFLRWRLSENKQPMGSASKPEEK